MGPKETIFHILHQSGDVVSGESISSQLGMSRVSVWKHIKGMVQSGISIESSPKGYRLAKDADSLVPLTFGSRAERIHYFESLSSTMDKAGELARQDCHDFTVVVAQRQTHGRGRMQRSWLSADGGLYFTIVVRPDVPILLASLVNLAAAVDMADAVNTSFHVDAVLKWPNDILTGGQKLCGILSQMDIEGDQLAHICIGIGLNVNNSPERDEPKAVSLKALLGHKVPRREILVGFLDRFESRMQRFEANAIIEQWKANNATLGQSVRVLTRKESHEGVAVDIDAHGGLVLRQSDGGLRTVNHGDCFHQ